MSEMEMPTPCVVCGELFDLNDGYASEVRKERGMSIIICKSCHEIEEEYLDIEYKIDELKDQISNYRYDIDEANSNIEYWEKELYKAEDELKELEDKLSKMDL